MAYRLTRKQERSIAVNFNDYGIELLSPQPMDLSERDWRELLAQERMSEDLLACLNATQMARRQFREIARVAGLIFSGYPGQSKSMRQLQASSDLFYDVLHEFDPRNLLLEQARREVFEQQLEIRRLIDAMARIAASPIIAVRTPKLTPLAFPIWADRLRQQQLSSERWDQRVRRMADQLERAASKEITKDTKNTKSTKRTEAFAQTVLFSSCSSCSSCFFVFLRVSSCSPHCALFHVKRCD
jgi:ATP-dependent Lhr-like helicase